MGSLSNRSRQLVYPAAPFHGWYCHTFTRGKQNVHHLEREDLVALTVEAAAMAGVPLAGTSWIPGT